MFQKLKSGLVMSERQIFFFCLLEQLQHDFLIFEPIFPRQESQCEKKNFQLMCAI